MFKFKLYIKKKLRKILFIYNIFFFIYKIINYPKNFILHKKNMQIKKKSFEEYEKNNGFLKINYAGHDLIFKSFSPINYFHLKIGSQNENVFFKRLFEKIEEGMIVYDIGGHVGMYSLPFAKSVGTKGKVVVFEPEKKGFNAIQENLKLNNVKNAKLYPFAISNKSSKSDFYIRPDKDTHSLFQETLAPSKTGKQKKVNIQTYTIDDLIEKNIAPIPNFIKIDTEGAELKILDGIKKNYNKLKYIFIEIHPDALRLESIFNPEEEVEKKLKGLGFDHIEYLDNIHILAKKINV
tara:strand:+ start:1251 stop:2129 length:879 start_codon:yes stop_codon:yes gene_type:complete